MAVHPADDFHPKGRQLLSNSRLNRGTAFTQQERETLSLEGLLPPAETSLQQQSANAWQGIHSHAEAIDKWTALRDVRQDNEVLFYRIASDYRTELLPIIYTPTIGEVAQRFSELWRPSPGLILHPGLKGKFEKILSAIPEEVRIIVATDGERVLGLGDQGIGGMAISQGKVSLYTLFGGIAPNQTLPICLDVGTNNEALLNSASYLGWKQPRLTGEAYDQLIDEFVCAVRKVFPRALLQWEDFGKGNARRLLQKYRKEILSFNDDIQGTATVSLAGLLAAFGVASRTLSQERVVIYGGGSAGLGIAEKLMQYAARHGESEEEMASRIFVLDRRGLLIPGHPMHDPLQPQLAKTEKELAGWVVEHHDHITLMETVRNARPTILIGVSADGGAFTEEIVREMASHVERPIIFPLSNPTSKSEALPSDLMKWTEGRAIVATGSPFSPVLWEEETIQIGQCNNLYIFPGVGMGCLVAEAREVTESMLERAAEVLAEHSPALQNDRLSLFPDLQHAPEIARKIAVEVALQAQKDGVAPQLPAAQMLERLEQMLWVPSYASRR
jgi:malate dehydrogenase (oxaloacetate-decarboxylating)